MKKMYICTSQTEFISEIALECTQAKRGSALKKKLFLLIQIKQATQRH